MILVTWLQKDILPGLCYIPYFTMQDGCLLVFFLNNFVLDDESWGTPCHNVRHTKFHQVGKSLKFFFDRQLLSLFFLFRYLDIWALPWIEDGFVLTLFDTGTGTVPYRKSVTVQLDRHEGIGLQFLLFTLEVPASLFGKVYISQI